MSAKRATAGEPDGLAVLSEALGRPAPDELATLPPEALADLADAVRAARRAQNAALAGALESSLRIVPRPLRPVLRKILT